MAVCNLFNNLTNVSGNFLLFSQYVEDITRNYTESENYKVIPTRFVACNIDYSKVDIPYSLQLNIGVPKYFQNIFENGCAYLRNKSGFKWTPEISKNLFWNSMFEGKFLHVEEHDSNNVSIIPEVVYYDDINMHSYNEHKGMGYGEIYCYIPTSAQKEKCQVITTSMLENRVCDNTNTSNVLVGQNESFDITEYPQNYYYQRDYRMEFDDSTLAKLQPYADSKYNINTIILLYSIYTKLNDSWEPLHEYIPMGIYFNGMFDKHNLTNEVTKHVTTTYGYGTSYGLRICTRFSALPNGAIMSSADTVVDDSDYANICQLMTAMNENLSKMFEVTKSAINTTQDYKETLSIIKNNRTNVPYIHEVNGKDFWFVNGRVVSAVDGDKSCCNEYSSETIRKRFENLMDDDASNDYTYISDGTSCDCLEYSTKELAEMLGLNPDDYPEGGYYPPIIPEIDGAITVEHIATPEDIVNEFEKDQ